MVHCRTLGKSGFYSLSEEYKNYRKSRLVVNLQHAATIKTPQDRLLPIGCVLLPADTPGSPVSGALKLSKKSAKTH
jgi:hypothetical protein